MKSEDELRQKFEKFKAIHEKLEQKNKATSSLGGMIVSLGWLLDEKPYTSLFDLVDTVYDDLLK
jgi:hypothetical protein